MTQNERLDYLLRCLLAERKEYAGIRVPDDLSEKRRLLHPGRGSRFLSEMSAGHSSSSRRTSPSRNFLRLALPRGPLPC